jgi:UDP-N-acetyl-D-galactosamine dehydrogenase
MHSPRDSLKIGIIGLGYVGLPLAVEFGKIYPVVGYDINETRIHSLREHHDSTGELTPEEIAASTGLEFSGNSHDLKSCNVFIVTVPTPIDNFKQPDLRPLRAASELVGRVINAGDTVVFESTVYPGATEEECVPLIESVSGLKYNSEFFVGYSPERINPGDKVRTLTNITKVTSGSNPSTAEFVDELYRSIIQAGTYRASSIRVAEAAKIIENTQRDVNIALVNELSILFWHLGLDTSEVLEAASTKWNFVNLRPGLVGGHCIGVDPYYLVHKSMSAGHIPDVIRLAREINDGMARNLVSRLVKAMVKKGANVHSASVLVLGASFKENCADIRNTKVTELISNLRDYGMSVDLFDPVVDREICEAELHVPLLRDLPVNQRYDAVILAVPHKYFVDLGARNFSKMLTECGVFFDVKAVFPRSDSDLRL